jgi:hypothetical protein
MNSSTKGNITEAVVIQKLLQLGHIPLIPFGDGAPYDLAYEASGTLVRVQCKTARLKDGVIVFNSCSKSRDGKPISYLGKIDVFAVWSPDLNKVYIVPIEIAATTATSLRVEATKNNQTKGVLFASVYEV